MDLVAPRRALRAFALAIVALAACAGAAAPALAASTPAPLWRGDYETGNFSQWSQLNGNLTLRDRYFGIVTKPAVQGRYAFRSTLDGTAIEPGESGQRSMVLLFPSNVASSSKTGAYEGSERYYRTQLYFPSDF